MRFLGIFCAALQRNLPVLYQKNTVLWNGGSRERTGRNAHRQFVKDAVQKEAQANADVPAGNTEVPSEEQSVEK